MTDTPGDAALRRVVVEVVRYIRNAEKGFEAGAYEFKEWADALEAALEANTRHTHEGGGRCACGESGKPLMYTCEKCDETWFLPGGMDIFNGQLRTLLAQAAPQSGAPDAPSHESPWTQIIGGMPDFPDPDSVVTPAPDAPRVHCGGCHRTPWPPCPGVAPAPPALSAEEREALEVVVNCLCPEHRDEECVVPTRQETILRALLARTAEKP